MKTIFLFVLMMISIDCQAETNFQKNWEMFNPGVKCLEAERFELYIVKSIGHGLYEVRQLSSGRGWTWRIILKMNTKQFSSTGRLRGIKFKHKGTTEMKMEDGFMAEYDLVEECN